MRALNDLNKYFIAVSIAGGLMFLQACVSDYSYEAVPEAKGVAASSTGSTGGGGPIGGAPAPGPGGSSTGGTKSPCTPQLAQNLRVMFMVDASGSTQTDDPGATVRTTSVQNFLNANSAATNLSFSYSYFAANQLSYDYSTGMFSESTVEPFDTATQAQAAVTLFKDTYEQVQLNGTDYQNALATLGTIVTGDNTANPGKYSYAVVFMSDGQPNRGADTTSTIDPLVTNLINIVGSARMTLSAVYFSNSPDASDETLIDDMANTGNGQYVNGDSQNLSLTSMIQSIITVPSGACPTQ